MSGEGFNLYAADGSVEGNLAFGLTDAGASPEVELTVSLTGYSGASTVTLVLPPERMEQLSALAAMMARRARVAPVFNNLGGRQHDRTDRT